MKVAILGAGEFVGARIIESFQLGAGPSFAAIARHAAELTSAARFAVDLRVADFSDVDSLARSFSGCSAVVQVATVPPAEAKRSVTALCRAAAQAGAKRVIFLSSADVHGLAPPAGTDEKTALHTRHEEEAINALVLAERQLFTECRQLNLAAYALRAGFLYGPRSPVIAELASDLRDERAWLVQHGEGVCNSLYVDNLVAAVRLAIKAKTGAGSAFLLTDPETVTWREFYQTLAEELNIPAGSIRMLESAPDSDESAATTAPALRPSELAVRQTSVWQLPAARAAKELGYHPSVSFAEGMRRSAAWWRFAQGEFFAAA